MRLRSEKFRDLHRALSDAFDENDLSWLVRHVFEQRLDQISRGKNTGEMIVHIIEEAEKYEQLEKLIQTAHGLRPTHQDLNRIYLAWLREPKPQSPTLPNDPRIPFSVNSCFVGREADLCNLAEALKVSKTIATGRVQTVVITGLGGVGKTQLAVAFANRYRHHFTGGIFWLNFADANSIRAQVIACGGVGNMDLRPNDYKSLSLDEQEHLVLISWETPNPRLLIFDNCEDPKLLEKWRPRSGGCRILVTSRRAEWEMVLGVDTLPLGLLSRSESIGLLHNFRPDLPIDNPNLGAIAAKLGDLPLALHLAGSYLSYRRYAETPEDYLMSSDLFQDDSLQQVEQTFALSYDLLDAKDIVDALALRLLRHAAYFAPGALIPRAQLLTSANIDSNSRKTKLQADDSLHRLAELGLIEVENDGSLHLHLLLAIYVQDRNTNNDMKLDIEKGLYRVVAYLDSPIHLRHFLNNIDAVLQSGESKGLSLERAELLIHKTSIWGRLEPFDETAKDKAKQNCQKAITVLTKLRKSHGEHPEYRHLSAQAHLHLGNIAQAEAEASTEQAQKLFLDEAVVAFQKAKKSARQYGKNPLLTVSICKELGYTNALRQEWDKAGKNFREALQVLEDFRQSIDREEYVRRFARVKEALSNMHWQKGNSLVARNQNPDALIEYNEACRQTRESIETLNKLGRPTEDLALAHWNLGDYLLASGGLSGSTVDRAQACEEWRAAQKIAHNLKLDYIAQATDKKLAKHCDSQNK